MEFVQIAVVQRSKASHSELVTNIATMICVAATVRHCQSTSDSVASPHIKMAGWPSHFLDTVVLAWLVCKTRRKGGRAILIVL